MTTVRLIYLALAIAGTILPMFYFVRWFGDMGLSGGPLMAAWTANDAVTGLAWDLVVSAVALCVFIIAEIAVRRDYWLLICIPATFAVGVSLGLPLYLFLRSRPRA